MLSLSRRGWVRVISFLAALFLALVGCVLSLRRTMTVYQRSITNSYLRSFSQLVSSVSRIDSAMQKEIYVVTPAMTSLLSAEIQSEAATAQAAKDAGLRLDMEAPTSQYPSITAALDDFVKKHNC